MTEDASLFMDDQSEVVYSKPVLEFVTVANECCKFLETASTESKQSFVDKSHKLLTYVYLKASMLPKVESIFDGLAEKFVSEQDWTYVKEIIANKLVSHDTFVDIPDPLYPNSDNNSSVSISECFADIYQDLKDFTTAYNLGNAESMQDSLWEVNNNFQTYWGQRLLAILSNFHLLAFGTEELADEDGYQASDSNFASDNWFTREILGSDTE